MSEVTGPAALAIAMQKLYAAEINCGCASFWDGGFAVWIGDAMNGRKAETTVTVGEAFHDWPTWDEAWGAAGQWLIDTAVRLYPDCTLDLAGKPRTQGEVG